MPSITPNTPSSSTQPSSPDRGTLAVLGLGAMGSRMAERLLEAGFPVVVWNRSEGPAEALVASGARRAESPREAAAGASVVLSMVTDDAAAEQVWLGEHGAVAGLSTGALVIESSTVTPDWVRRLGSAVAERGARLVEAPVVGSRPQAEAGQLIALLAGAPEALDDAGPVLEVLTGQRWVVGALGQAAVAKLVVNRFFATQVAAAGEAIALLRGAGLEEADWLDMLTGMPVVAPAIAGAIRGMASGQFAPLFPISLVAKDLRYGADVAGELTVAQPLGAAAQALFERAVAQGDGDLNITGILRQLDRPEERRGVAA